MNFEPNFLPDYVNDVIQTQSVRLVETPVITTDIIYRRLETSTLDLSAGTDTPTWSDFPVKASKGSHRAGEISQSNGVLQVGDHFYIFGADQLPFFPQADDRILEDVESCADLQLTETDDQIIGYHTDFVKAGLHGGDILIADSLTAIIKSVESDTALTLKTPWTGDTKIVDVYKIRRIFKTVAWLRDPLKVAYRVSVRRAG